MAAPPADNLRDAVVALRPRDQRVLEAMRRLQVTAGSTPIGSVTIVEGATSGVGGSPALIPAEAVIQIAVLEVGLTFPGSGLTLMARF